MRGEKMKRKTKKPENVQKLKLQTGHACCAGCAKVNTASNCGKCTKAL